MGPARRIVTAVLIPLLGIVALTTFGLWAGQRRLIYFPDSAAPSPAFLGQGWEEVTYGTADGLTLHGWYRPPAPGRPVVVVFNGNAGNRAGRLGLGEALAVDGLGVLLTDYRGYGGNPGHPSEDGLALDARAAAAFVESAAPDHPLVFFGESLGAAVAIEVAGAVEPAALVLRSPFTSLVDVGRVHYPWLPVGLLLKDRYPSLERIETVAVPVMVIAGDADSIIPIAQSRKAYDAAPGPKQWLAIQGADHNDLALAEGPDMVRAVLSFIASSGG